MKLFRYTGLSLMLCALLCSCAHRGARSGAVHDRSYYEGLYFASLDKTEHIRSYSLGVRR